jgi:hypothetical protein
VPFSVRLVCFLAHQAYFVQLWDQAIGKDRIEEQNDFLKVIDVMQV